MDDNVGARLTLATLLQEDGREDDAMSILSPPEDAGDRDLKCSICCIALLELSLNYCRV